MEYPHSLVKEEDELEYDKADYNARDTVKKLMKTAEKEDLLNFNEIEFPSEQKVRNDLF